MKLKSIIIKGFKSFYKKTKIEFPDGLISIIGPNGSGKSNILDAIRWVLGEQSVKSLRGEKMEDVIFAGTSKYSKLNFCEVEVIFDNTDDTVNIPFSEISIKRKLYRDGNNIYYINNKPVRLKDVRELFFDSGIGKEGYSIISQGKIDEIINSSSLNRRKIFEEASGISKYRYHKDESEKKINIANQNLERLNDIFSEIKNQIEPLKLQKEKASKYLELRENLRDIDISYNLNEINKITEKMVQSELDFNNVNDKFIDITSKIDFLNQELTSNNNNLDLMEEKIAEFNTLENSLKIKSNDIKNNIENKNNIKTIKQDYLNKLFDEKNSNISQSNQNNELKEAKLENYNALKSDISFLLARQDEINKKLSFENNEELSNKNAIYSLQRDIQEYQNKLLEINTKKEINSDSIKRNSENLEILAVRSKTEKENLGNLLKTENELNKINADLNDKLLDYQKNISEIRNQIDNHTNNLKTVNDAYSKLFETYRNNVVQQQTYVKLENDLDGLNNSVKKILKNTSLNGILDVVSNIVKVDEKYEKAIEIALGAGMQNIVTVDTNSAKSAIEYLKKTSSGRATFLPLNTINANPLNIDNVILCSDVVFYDKKYDNIIKFLLGRTILSKDMDEALAISKKYNNKYRIVTLDGELISIGGSISGGHYYKSNNIFSRKRIINELENIIKMQNIELEKFIEDKSKIEKNLKLLNEEYSSKTETYSSQKNSLEINKIKIADIKNSIFSQNNLILEIDKEKDNLSRDLEQSRLKMTDLEKELSLYNDKINDLEINKAEKESTIQTNLLKLDKYQKEIQDIINQKREKENLILSLEKEIEFIDKNLNDNNFKLESTQREIDNLHLEIGEIEKEIYLQIEDSQLVNIEIDELEIEFSELKEDFSKQKSKISKILKEKEDIEKDNFELLEKKINIKNSIDNYVTKKEEIIQYLQEEYDYQNFEIIQITDNKYSLSDVNKIKNSIKNLGNVNIDAIDEYDKLNERYELYQSQISDLENSITELNLIISNFESAMREEFSESFKNISDTFSVVFKKIFGGGEGRIELDNIDDVLSANIEIYAQPPGKKLKNLTMMSGGEKALVAIALLFAIQITRPAPFCILDEIDAPLDDANVYKFSKFLKEMSASIQFITITHRRGTIESSKYIYGISMQEKGVSNVVSMKFEEALDYIEQ